MNYRAWQLKNADTAGESALLAAGYGPLLARVLACRGIAQPQAAAALLEEEPPLSDPFLLKDMDKAVARIQQLGCSVYRVERRFLHFCRNKLRAAHGVQARHTAEVYLKSRKFSLFLQAQRDFALKSLKSCLC